MSFLPNILFFLLAAGAGYFAFRNFGRVRRNILLGREEDRTDNSELRWKTMLLVALGQKKMFARPVPAILHLVIYLGFLIVNLEMLEIVLDGLLGTHRIFSAKTGAFYAIMVNTFEIFAFGVIVVCLCFLSRRYLLKLKRFQSAEMTSWPRKDATIILMVEIVLMTAFLTMNAADRTLQMAGNPHYHDTGNFLISQWLMPLFSGFGNNTLVFIERTAWWLHITGVFIFLNYLPFSKHLHIMLAFPNTYYSNLKPKGEMNNMPEVTKEVKLMLNLPVEETTTFAPPAKFGAKDVTDLSWKSLLEAYTCTECGRCTSVCPANLTGKKLSPRKIMMDTRDRLEEVGLNLEKNGKDYNDGKSLLGDYISHEELLACTTCNACTEACPVNIDPLRIILDLRRFKIMEESNAPQSWNMMFQNIETNFAPWKFPASDRFKWSERYSG